MNLDHRRQLYLRRMGVQSWSERRLSPVVERIDQRASQLGEGGWASLQDQVLSCHQCALSSTRRQPVFGAGDRSADWLFLGEAPGAEEDKMGLPFVGRAGKLLDAMLLAMGLERNEVYIANVLKCRPPENRDPMGEEVSRCLPFLSQQIELMAPKMILAMGRFAAQSLLGTDSPISRLRGAVHHYGNTSIPTVVTYHPAYLLRTPGEKRKVWQDLLFALEETRRSLR